MICNYKHIISFGSTCCPGLILQELGVKKETYPFDWLRTNTKIIYDILINGPNRYTSFNKEISDDYLYKDLNSYTHPDFPLSHVNYYGQHFTHYTNINTLELIKKFEKYMSRFFNLLNSSTSVVFINTHEEYIYHKKSRESKDELYEYLCKINDMLAITFPNLTFKIINIDMNNNYKDYGNILNYNLKYDLPFSDYCEHFDKHFYNPYRKEVMNILKDIFN
jgi:hypothetical protein